MEESIKREEDLKMFMEQILLTGATFVPIDLVSEVVDYASRFGHVFNGGALSNSGNYQVVYYG